MPLQRPPGQFTLPGGIYISAADHVYVADAYNQRVQIFLGAVANTAAHTPDATEKESVK